MKVKPKSCSTKINKITAALLATLLTPLTVVGAESESQTADTQEVEVIRVTGSNIRKYSTFETSTPVQVIDRDLINAQGAATVQDILVDLPVNVGSQLNNEQNSLAGTTQFNLRGLGLASTLTLINGRRGGKSAVADNGGNFFFDVNQLPISVIKRIDVQTDGASAIYGSEAVAGVVNIITRKGFEGVEVSANYEDASNEAGSLNLALGEWGDRGGINVYATYYHQTGNTRTDFDWLNERLNHVGDLQGTRLSSANGAPGTYFRSVTDSETGLPIQLAGAQAFADPDCLAAGQVLRGNTCRHIFADQNGVIHESTRYQIFSEFEYDLNDKLTVFGELSFSRNDLTRFRGPGNYSNGLITGAQQGRVFIPGDHPFNFFIEDPNDPTAIQYIGPEAWDNSIHTGVDLSARARILGNEFNGRNSPANRTSDINYFRSMTGFTYEINDDWSLEMDYVASLSNWDQSTFLDYAAATVNQLLLDGLFNPFGTRVANPTLVSPKDGVSVAGLSDDVLNQLITRQTQEASHDQYVIDLILAGALFDLPAGTVGFAFGYQHRDEEFDFSPSELRAAGQGGLRDRLFPLSGKLEVDAYYVEAAVPVLENVELQLALRYEDYGFTDTTDPKIAVRWDISDEWTVRSSFGSSFQAPSIRQANEARSASIIDDPVGIDPATGLLGCNAFGQSGNTSTRTVGSPDLSPQSADNFNFGIIARPTEAFNISVDYWYYDYTDLISSDEGPQAIVDNDCDDDGTPNDRRVTRSPGGNILLITSEFINTSSVTTDGLDVSMQYRHDADDLGQFDFGLNASYINSFDFKTTPSSPEQSAVGLRNERNQFSSTPELRGNVSVNWKRENYFAGATVRYVDSYLNDAFTQDDGSLFEIDSFVTVDIQFGAEFSFTEGGESKVTVGVKNLFDEDPPSLGNLQRPSYDPTLANIRGRIAYIDVVHKF
ncbi:TonB-dependent receptor [Endozoicomonas sp. G2_1]|uniref:TonB-dependent receptor domain-containing protein n=1 Tax=Endozoicomonas sp. G2_1 TaxID=2821091 RepID=UPI001ADB4D48|nr:TonB-dependent receptor [Endozoicomonas sp. G2_1]MBO9490312.1 TonB-dependent receptor [Endozoicomonas sp. G2_1]